MNKSCNNCKNSNICVFRVNLTNTVLDENHLAPSVKGDILGNCKEIYAKYCGYYAGYDDES